MNRFEQFYNKDSTFLNENVFCFFAYTDGKLNIFGLWRKQDI